MGRHERGVNVRWPPAHRAAIQHKFIILFDKMFVIPLVLLMSSQYQSHQATYNLFFITGS